MLEGLLLIGTGLVLNVVIAKVQKQVRIKLAESIENDKREQVKRA